MAGNDCAWSSQYIVALAQNKYTNSVGILALVPLALQFFTGLYLLVLPYATKWRGAATHRLNIPMVALPTNISGLLQSFASNW